MLKSCSSLRSYCRLFLLVCAGRLVLIAGIFMLIPGLAKAISAGGFVDLALGLCFWGGGSGLLLLASSNWMSVLVHEGISSWVVLVRLLLPLLVGSLIACFLLIFLCFLLSVLMVGRLRFPCLIVSQPCGPPAGLALLTGHLVLSLVLFRMLGMCVVMILVLYLLRL